LEKYNTLTDLIDGMEAMKDKKKVDRKWDDKEESWKDRQIGYIIKGLEKDREHESKMIEFNRESLQTWDKFEYKLKEL
jgi:hypothetical protein